jgi:hypothetical protein
MKKTFLSQPASIAMQLHAGGFFAVPERTVFSYRYTSFWVRR